MSTCKRDLRGTTGSDFRGKRSRTTNLNFNEREREGEEWVGELCCYLNKSNLIPPTLHPRQQDTCKKRQKGRRGRRSSGSKITQMEGRKAVWQRCLFSLGKSNLYYPQEGLVLLPLLSIIYVSDVKNIPRIIPE